MFISSLYKIILLYACLFCRLKTRLRSEIGQERLRGLAPLRTRREISTEDIILRFAKMKRRRTDLIL